MKKKERLVLGLTLKDKKKYTWIKEVTKIRHHINDEGDRQDMKQNEQKTNG